MGEEAAEKPVKARFISVKVGSEESWMNGQLEEGPLQLVFEIRLDIKPHLSFQRNFDSIQYLEMTDSSEESWPLWNLIWAICISRVMMEKHMHACSGKLGNCLFRMWHGSG